MKSMRVYGTLSLSFSIVQSLRAKHQAHPSEFTQTSPMRAGALSFLHAYVVNDPTGINVHDHERWQ